MLDGMVDAFLQRNVFKKKKMKQKLILIGSGMVGARFIEKLLQEANEQYEIQVFNKEPNGGYNRIMLSPVLSGEKPLSDIMTHDSDWFAQKNVKLHISTEIVSVDKQSKTVTTDFGDVYSYDKLVIATGSNPFIIPVPGHKLPGVVAFRDIGDVNTMLATAKNKQKAVVIGGGLLGLEAANGLIKQGMDVTVVHLGNVLMEVQMDEVSGGLLKANLEVNGMKFAMPAQTAEILGKDYVTGVKFADGSQIDTDLVVMAVGIRPNIGVGQKLNLDINRGILVNDHLETSAKDIYALGECVEHRGVVYGLVAPLYEQAQVLAENLTGKKSSYQGSFISTKLKVTGISLFSAGDFQDSAESESLVYKDLTQNIYRKIVLKDNKVQGAVMFGDVSGSNWIFDNLVEQRDMSGYRDTLVFGEGFDPSIQKVREVEVKEENSMNKQKIVVIGNGMVGHNFIEKLVASEGYDNFEVHTFCEEPRVAYDRVYLSSYFSGKTAEDLSLVKPGFYEENNVTIYMNDKAVDVDIKEKTVTSQAGVIISYDKLIMATGSFPFVPPIKGNDREGCLVYRTIEDLEAMKAVAAKGKVGVVVGGGLLGLEAAKALVDLGLDTHVVEFAPRLMPVQLDDGGSALLKRKIENLGVTVHASKATNVIQAGKNCMNKMVFADGEELETDMVLFSAGIRARDDLAKKIGLELGPRGGIVIDDQCKTNHKDIFAIGECALHEGMIYGLVAPGYAMAQAVVNQLNAEPGSFTGADMSTKLKLMGIDVASIGDPHGTDENALSYVYENGPEEIYKKIVVTPDGKKLLGAVLVGDAEDFGNLLQIMLNDMDLPEHPDMLILPNRDGSGGGDLFGPDALPDTAQLCSCYDVSKGDIVNAVETGCCTMADIKASTEAGAGCGGCIQLVTNVLNNELEKRGVEVNTDICEHFKHTRQELYHICQVEEIKDFDSLISTHGSGYGCGVCKQASGSIFASLWNVYALEADNIPLQDTNDNYLGNMQKDGTYSVIPRVPGGEITPDKLIVLGEVANKYKLYTKVNGGQRIVLFGAQMNDLPSIWKILIDAGFESGQAYAKSLRTVKSCVGSTWCRFGLDDSVTMAIELENRYKGVRSPHKLKMGVSGCTRECAEAQAKDIGLISTENGWNLFVCGNGGMKPRHADLFATDLTKEDVFKYIDRLLMFYIKTADKLQRTATWMDNLEGGLSYLQDVVINDSLNMANELEAQMKALQSTYKCDWKTAIENPEFTKRFRSFVNVDSPSEQLFVQERGQIRPATESEKLSGVAVEIKKIA